MLSIPLKAALALLLFISFDIQAQTVEEERDTGARPIDYGPGPGLPKPGPLAPEMAPAAPAAAGANVTGAFGPAATWPLIPIHSVLLSDGRVLNYGSNENGVQGAQLMYNVWDPRNPGAHFVLPNTTGTDVFCGAQSLLLGSGNALLAGGDMTIGTVRNFSNDRTTIFDATNNGIIGDRPSMMFRRWYATLVPLPHGDKLILGGREDKETPTITPEVYNDKNGWRTLYNAADFGAFGDQEEKHWYYPRAYQLPNDREAVIVMAHHGDNYRLTPAGDGAIGMLTAKAPRGDFRLPSVMFAPGKVLSVRKYQIAVVFDINGPEPIITQTSYVNALRFWSSATVLADGKVLLNGGSAVANQLIGISADTQIWDPATGAWTTGALAAKPRLYHSTALLLPDATVLTGGSGSPGPIKQLNAEIYYPPYLYDPTGQPAQRPILLSAPEVLTTSTEPLFWATVANGNQISRVTLVHAGSQTHSTDVEQRFQDLSFVQDGQGLLITSPSNPNYTVAGYYLLFAFNTQGVPSEAKIIKIRHVAPPTTTAG